MNQRIRDVFAAPPEEFVRVRDALVKELRGAGHAAEAKEVAALRRPTTAVWAVNQLSRTHGAELDDFIEASDRVRHAQMRGAAAEGRRAAERNAKRQAAESRKRARAARAAEARLRKLEQKAKAAEEAATRAREAVLNARSALDRLRSSS